MIQAQSMAQFVGYDICQQIAIFVRPVVYIGCPALSGIVLGEDNSIVGLGEISKVGWLLFTPMQT